MNFKKTGIIMFTSLGLIGGMLATIAMQTHAASTTSAASSADANSQDNGQHRGTPPAAAGSVTAISGNTITVTDKRSGTTYTVDASSATIQKMPAMTNTTGSAQQTPPTPATISVSGIAIGDNVMIQGTVSGTNITATSIMDGQIGGPGGHGPRDTMGTVSAINGNTITLTGEDGTAYTVDASKSSVKKISAAVVSDIAVGDKLEVSGSTSGTTVTATNILDGQLGNPGQPSTTTAPPKAQ